MDEALVHHDLPLETEATAAVREDEGLPVRRGDARESARKAEIAAQFSPYVLAALGRPELIERTLQSLEGAPRAIIHLYNAVAPAFRRIVFGMERSEVRDIARHRSRWPAPA